MAGHVATTDRLIAFVELVQGTFLAGSIFEASSSAFFTVFSSPANCTFALPEYDMEAPAAFAFQLRRRDPGRGERPDLSSAIRKA